MLNFNKGLWPVLILFLMGCSHLEKQKEAYSGFGRESVSEEQLKTYAPTPLAPELKNSIEKYMDVRAPSPGMTGPGGRQLFMNWMVTGSNQVWRLDAPKSFPVQMTGGEDRTGLRDVSPDGKWVALSRDAMGDEFYGIFLQPSAGGKLLKVFQKPKVRAGFGFFSSNSRSVYYTANDINENSQAVYRYDIAARSRELLLSEPGLWEVEDYLDDDNLILAKHVGSMQNEHYLFNPSTKLLTPLIGQGKKEDYRVAFGRNKGEYVVLTDELREFKTLYSLKEGKLKPLTPDWNFNVEFFELNRPRTYLVFVTNEKGYEKVRAFSALNFKEISFPRFEAAEQVYAGSFSPDGRYLTLAVETPRSPNTNYVYDFSTKKLRQWSLSSSPEIDTSRFVKAELDSYRAEDGTQIPMFVWRSEACKTKLCPVIVNFHGGPEGQATPGFSPIINSFLEQGFVYVMPNVRGSDGYGKSWVRADNGPKRLDVITDIRDCARYIREKWKVKEVSPKIGIYGGSYGGYSTLVGMSMFAGEYDAGVAVVGMSDLRSFLLNTAPYRRALRVNEYGDPEKDKEALEKLSPVTYINKVKAPILILQGASDPRVPAGEALQFYEQVKNQVPDSGMVLFPDEGHGVSKRPNRVLLTGYVIEFFKKHL
jgi:dipeptidyl aminopeptidase/acylaminoacyl peptidase